jgi:UDP-glucose 4-epimerase
MDRIAARTYNLGSGTGYSNGEVIDTVRVVTGRQFPVIQAGRRAGDPARLVADASRIREELGWEPAVPQLREMVRTAWQWRVAHPHGY